MHRVGLLRLLGGRRGRGRVLVLSLGALVGARLVQMKGARGTLRGRGRERRRRVDRRGRAVEIVGALRVLRPLLLEKTEARHRSGGRGMLADLPWLRGWRWLLLFPVPRRAITVFSSNTLEECAGPQSTQRRIRQQQLGAAEARRA